MPESLNSSEELANKIISEYLRDQKAKRRWRWFKRIVFIIALLILAYVFLFVNKEDKVASTKDHVGLIDLKGAIFDSYGANAENFAKSLATAYKSSGLRALVIRINSPGGEAVQADYMYNLIRHYREKYPKIKTYAVCVDMCASAAYYIAAATDEIYANPASMVGSIGVLYNGFGFVDTLQKLGVQRRLQTAGVNKGFLDPFSPVNPAQEKLLQTMLDDIHEQFIAKVKEGRGDRLKINDTIFSGLFWTGKQALDLGLIDGFASSSEVARKIVKVDPMIDYTYKNSVLERLSKNIGSAFADNLPTALGLRSGVSLMADLQR